MASEALAASLSYVERSYGSLPGLLQLNYWCLQQSYNFAVKHMARTADIASGTHFAACIAWKVTMSGFKTSSTSFKGGLPQAVHPSFSGNLLRLSQVSMMSWKVAGPQVMLKYGCLGLLSMLQAMQPSPVTLLIMLFAQCLALTRDQWSWQAMEKLEHWHAKM